MENPVQASTPRIQTGTQNYTYPDQMRNQAQEVASTVKLLLEIPKSISTLRRIFRGEALYQSEDGTTRWIQTVKPVFIKLDKDRKPIMIEVNMPDGTKQLMFSPNDEAIEEILSELFFMGINQLTPLTNLKEDTILDDLKEFECKLAGVLMQNQVKWGIDKSLMPMVMTKIKTIVQDSRYMCVEGRTMRALSQQVSRIEQVIEGDRNLKKPSPYS